MLAASAMLTATALGAPLASRPMALEEIVVTATRVPTPAMEVPALTYALSQREMQLLDQSRTLPQALAEIPGVMVQKTSYGQGSPFIRGYTGFRNVLLVDGIRLNNSVFREGANQYWNTVDLYSVERIEVLKGASSVLYGSDAVGAAVNAMSDIPGDTPDGFTPRLLYRYADAENSHVGRVQGSYSGGGLGLRGGFTYKDYGDLEGGPDVGRQPRTGYDERNADLRLEYAIGEQTELIAGYQYVDQDDAWRTHRTIYGISWKGTDVGTDLEFSLDQRRELGYLQLRHEGLGALADNLHASLSYHRQSEDQSRTRSNLRTDLSGFDVGTTGLWAQLDKQWGGVQLLYGFDYYHDDVDSYRTDFRADGSVAAVRIQGPVADDSSYDLAGLFVQGRFALSPRFEATLGGRYTYAGLDAGRVQDPLTGEQTSFDDSWDDFSASAQLSFFPEPEGPWMLFAGVAQAFRAPNLSDMTRLDTARSNEIETPVLDLEPETFITYEAGVKAMHERWTAQAAYFYTEGSDVIVRTPTGRTVDGLREVTKRNTGRSRVDGIEARLSVDLTPQLLAWGDLFWIDGEQQTYPTSEPVRVTEPLDVLMPPTWRLGLRWTTLENRLRLEALVEHADEQDKLSTRDKADTQRIPPGGTPSYTVAHLRSEWRLWPAFFLSLAVENLTDEDYRIHGSGVNEAGRNVILSLTYSP
jgi:hemoglobin/transferrin/lactoferrin receptor protein